jgi:hypothetical protein
MNLETSSMILQRLLNPEHDSHVASHGIELSGTFAICEAVNGATLIKYDRRID